MRPRAKANLGVVNHGCVQVELEVDEGRGRERLGIAEMEGRQAGRVLRIVPKVPTVLGVGSFSFFAGGFSQFAVSNSGKRATRDLMI